MQNLFWARVLRQVVVVETVCFGRSSLATTANRNIFMTIAIAINPDCFKCSFLSVFCQFVYCLSCVRKAEWFEKDLEIGSGQVKLLKILIKI